jgi:DNA polymerase delta subunit 1
VGYNTINFDFPYLLNRAKALKCDKFGLFSRMRNVLSRIKDSKFLSKVMGMRETKEINMEGRI